MEGNCSNHALYEELDRPTTDHVYFKLSNASNEDDKYREQRDNQQKLGKIKSKNIGSSR